MVKERLSAEIQSRTSLYGCIFNPNWTEQKKINKKKPVLNEEINQPRLCELSPHLSIIPGISFLRRGIFNFAAKHSLTSPPLQTLSRHVAGKRDAEK